MKQIITLYAVVFLIFSCKNETTIEKNGFIFTKESTGVNIKKDGQLIGRLLLGETNDFSFLPARDSLIRIGLSEDGVYSINRYNYVKNLHGGQLVFSKSSVPYKMEWYNNGNMFSQVNNFSASQGYISRSNINYIDTNMITMPKVIITKGDSSVGLYRLTVFCGLSYPIYLMGITYNIINDSEPEYDFISNSFSILFSKKDLDPQLDTLKLSFNYFPDYVNEEQRRVIKTLKYQTKID